MKYTLQRLALGILLIAAAAAILLVSDRQHRKPGRSKQARVAVFQFSSRPILDDSVRGVMDALAAQGFVPGKTILIRKFNPENDLPTAHAIAKEITGGGFGMVITVSTPCLQVMAAANREGKVMHVFGTVTDPFGAGVGINRTNSLDRPAHLAGLGTFQPVKEVFRLAKQAYPDLARVGVVWCPLEACSEACVRLGREICGELGIGLLEAQVDNTAGILEAADSLVERGVQALWIGGDNIIESAPSSVVQAARKGRIPVFANAPGHVDAGALIGLGADYYEVGRCEGELAARILKGANPAAMRVENVVPQQLAVNLTALENLRDPWRIPPEMLARSARVLDAGQARSNLAVSAARPAAGRSYKIGIAHFGPDPSTEDCIEGFCDGLQALGYERGKNLQVFVHHAQAEIVNIPQMIQTLDNQDLDLLVPMTTPCLTAAIAAAKRTPIVFASVYDPLAAGAGESFERHLPRLTGVGSAPPLGETFAVIRKLCPQVRKIGTLFNPSEANSSKAVQKGRSLSAGLGIKLEEVPINAVSEVLPAAQVLASRGVQALWITGDNTALQALAGIVKVARDNKLPLFCNDLDFLDQGPLAGIGFSFYQAGYAAAAPAARVMNGESPAGIPIVNVAQLRQGLNFRAAAELGIVFPPDVLAESAVFSHVRARLGRPGRVVLVGSDKATNGPPILAELQRGLGEAGLVAGEDVVVAQAGTNIPAGADALVAADAAGLAAARLCAGIPVFDLVPGAGREIVGQAREAALAIARVLAGAPSPDAAPVPAKAAQVRLLSFIEEPNSEDVRKGFLDGLKSSGLVSGRTMEIKASCAQGDMATLMSMVNDAVGSHPDLLAVISTPTLQAALQKAGALNVVFGNVANPVVAGAGESYARHRANVTGVSTLSDFEGTVKVIKECLPAARRIGTLFCPAEVNSVYYKDELAQAAQGAGLNLVALPVAASGDVADTALALAGRDIDAICQVSDNLNNAAFSGIVQAARKHKKPLFAFGTPNVKSGGACVAVARDFEQAGRDMAGLAARVLRGESPGAIPFQNVSTTRIVVNLDNAGLCGLAIPASLLQRADEVFGEDSRSEKGLVSPAASPATNSYLLGLAYFAPEPGCELAQRGLMDGLRRLGFEEGRNLAVRRSHAQGDISLIPTMLQVLDNSGIDALAAFTTPVLSAACGMMKRKPVVFAYITDPVAAGAGRSMEDHLPHVTGIGSFPPMDTVLEFMRRLLPGLNKLGVIYNTSDASSSKIVSALRPLCPPAGVRLEEVTAINTSEVDQAIRALLDRGVQMVYIPSDNTAYQALDIIVSATRSAKVPLVVDDAAFLDRGVTASAGLSYYEAGVAAASMLSRVLRGESPAAIPMRNLSAPNIAINRDAARQIGLVLPPEALKMETPAAPGAKREADGI